MTETRSTYGVKGQQLSISTDELLQLRERVRELEYALAQCQDDASADAKYLAGNVVEARSWARTLLARSENLTWLVERVGAFLREDIEELEARQAQAAIFVAERDSALRWAKGWKEAAKHLRRAWLRGMPPPPSWRKRRDTVMLGPRIPPVIYEDDLIHFCSQCGKPMQIVRPGKWQCNSCQ